MIALYKRWRDKAEKTGWGVNVKEHDQAADSGSSLMTIREILISKCSYYYEFEEIMGTSPNVAPPYIVESGHPDRVTLDEPSEDIDAQKYELFLQSGQDEVSNSEDLPIDQSLLSSAQRNSVLLGINLDNLDESQTSLAKNILPGDGSITEEEDADLDINISGDEFDYEFPSGQKVFSTQHSHPVSASQTNTSQFTSPPSQRTPLVPCSSNAAPPSTQRTSLASRSSHIRLPKPIPETKSKRKRGPGKKQVTTPVLIDSDSENERSSRRRRLNSNLSMAEALVQTKAMDKAMHKQDMELRKEDNERKAQMFERSEKDAARRHEQVMAEIEERRIRSKIQFAAMKRGKKIVLSSDSEQDED